MVGGTLTVPSSRARNISDQSLRRLDFLALLLISQVGEFLFARCHCGRHQGDVEREREEIQLVHSASTGL